MRSTFAYILATILCFSGCTTNQTVPSPSPKQEIKKQAPATHTYLDEFTYDPYPFVGSICYSDGSLIGSGVLIAPNLILTAAHVTEGKDDLMFVEYDGDKHCVKTVVYHPDYVPDILGHDIAVVVLETESDEQPVEFAVEPEKRRMLITAGYGTGRKRYSNYGVFWYYGRLMAAPQFMIMLPLEGTMWFGDSGGGVFTLDNKLVGIMSYFQATRSGKIYENGCASIEYYRNWIGKVKCKQTP